MMNSQFATVESRPGYDDPELNDSDSTSGSACEISMRSAIQILYFYFNRT